jgi:hypothetical protein
MPHNIIYVLYICFYVNLFYLYMILTKIDISLQIFAKFPNMKCHVLPPSLHASRQTETQYEAETH